MPAKALERLVPRRAPGGRCHRREKPVAEREAVIAVEWRDQSQRAPHGQRLVGFPAVLAPFGKLRQRPGHPPASLPIRGERVDRLVAMA